MAQKGVIQLRASGETYLGWDVAQWRKPAIDIRGSSHPNLEVEIYLDDLQ